MVEDNPNQFDLEQMMKFCKKHEGHLYIWDHGITEQMISKYLYYSSIHINGFIKYEVDECDTQNEPFPVISFSGGGKSYSLERLEL